MFPFYVIITNWKFVVVVVALIYTKKIKNKLIYPTFYCRKKHTQGFVMTYELINAFEMLMLTAP